MNEPQATRKRLRKQARSSEEILKELLATPNFSENGVRRRRRRRLDSTDSELAPPIPHPLKEAEQRSQIDSLAAEMANQAAQKLLSECLSPQMQAALQPEQLREHQTEISASIASSLKSQLDWALNQVWLEAQQHQQRRMS